MSMTPIDELVPSGSGDPLSLGNLAQEAQDFLKSHEWCKRIRQGYLDIGWDGILGVFLFEIEPSCPGVDDTVWVIAGDLPPAYVCNDSPNGPSALDAYVKEMQRWADAAKAGKSVAELIPVDVPPTAEYARMLEARLQFIRDELLAQFADMIPHDPIATD